MKSRAVFVVLFGAVAFWLASVGSASSMAPNGAVQIKTLIPCSEYLRNRDEEKIARASRQGVVDERGFIKPQMATNVLFIMGFLTGVNYYMAGVSDVAPYDLETILLLVQRECEADVTLSLDSAIALIIGKNKDRWKRD